MPRKKSILYVITNISMPHLVKVGITDDLAERLKTFNGKTEMPTRFQVYAEFNDIENPDILEQEILRVFSEKRVNKKREFIEEHPERICDFIRENKKIKEEKEKAGLFTDLGIKKGSILKFTDGEKIYPDIRAEVGIGRNVIFKRKKTSLSQSALSVLNKQFDRKWKSARGPDYWTYKGRTIRELSDEIK